LPSNSKCSERGETPLRVGLYASNVRHSLVAGVTRGGKRTLVKIVRSRFPTEEERQ